ncbi:MAG TPA: NHLP family bacteriocin export ABC transporter peptidase/permease/ATPase subunit, partial [Aggregatilineales bacterium]|nr:NHLP family bacteriocin export ABC transporter peptidase/permease/ATPase subunit [Aggregatilineales bacterium]
LEELRVACDVTRDGSKASNVIKAGRKYGLNGKGLRTEPEDLMTMKPPIIIFWNFNHFLVVEGFGRNQVYLNDPASGPRTVSFDDFDGSYTGVALTFEVGPNFVKGGEKRGLFKALARRLPGSQTAVVYVVLVGLALVITGLVLPVFLRVFVDNILIGGQDWIVALLIGMGLAALVRGALTALQQYYLLRFETKLAVSSSGKFLWHVLRLPVEFFAQRYAGDISSRVAINDNVAQLLSGELATAVLNIVLIVFYALLMFQYSVPLTLIGIFIAGINLLALRYVSRRRIDANQRLQKELAKLYGVTFNGLHIIETLKASGGETDFFGLWSGYQAKALNASQQLGVSTQFLAAAPPFLSALSTIAILALGGLLVMHGQMTVGMLVAFQALMISFLTPVNQMIQLGSTLQEIEGDMNRLDDVQRYRTDPQLDGTQGTSALLNADTKLAGALELRDIAFGYSRLSPPLIEAFSLKLKPGDRVALVGSSGSGKSTVGKLIAGLFEPWSGEILFDGKPRSETPRIVLNNSLAMVDQDVFIFDGTVRENLTLWDSTVSEMDIIQAAKDACIHEEIAGRSGGYDHVIEEGGRNLSGGQRQRLEIARALATNPTLLVLDEATSALDPIIEKTIDDNLRRRGCTCLIVAHRLSTIRDCDEIIVLERGKVVQRGTHAEMYMVDGPYARLIRSESYQSDKPQSVLDLL